MKWDITILFASKVSYCFEVLWTEFGAPNLSVNDSRNTARISVSLRGIWDIFDAYFQKKTPAVLTESRPKSFGAPIWESSSWNMKIIRNLCRKQSLDTPLIVSYDFFWCENSLYLLNKEEVLRYDTIKKYFTKYHTWTVVVLKEFENGHWKISKFLIDIFTLIFAAILEWFTERFRASIWSCEFSPQNFKTIRNFWRKQNRDISCHHDFRALWRGGGGLAPPYIRITNSHKSYSECKLKISRNSEINDFSHIGYSAYCQCIFNRTCSRKFDMSIRLKLMKLLVELVEPRNRWKIRSTQTSENEESVACPVTMTIAIIAHYQRAHDLFLFANIPCETGFELPSYLCILCLVKIKISRALVLRSIGSLCCTSM